MADQQEQKRDREFDDDGRTIVPMDSLPDRMPFGLSHFPSLSKQGKRNNKIETIPLTRQEKWAMFKTAVQVILPAVLIFAAVFSLLLLGLLWLWGAF